MENAPDIKSKIFKKFLKNVKIQLDVLWWFLIFSSSSIGGKCTNNKNKALLAKEHVYNNERILASSRVIKCIPSLAFSDML